MYAEKLPDGFAQDPPLPGTPLEGQSKKKERTSKTSAEGEGEGSNGGALDAEQERRDGFDQIPTDPAGLQPSLD